MRSSPSPTTPDPSGSCCHVSVVVVVGVGMEREKDTFDVVVVGGGLAGLVAAVTAANGGGSVALLDARSFGGRGRSVDRDGFILNEGGHALYRGGGGWDVLTSLGVHPRGVTPNAAGYRVLWHGEVAPLPTTATGILTTRLLGVRSKAKFAGWFNDMAGTARKAGDVSLDQWMDDQGTRPDLRTLLTALGRLVTYGARPGDMPASAVLGQFALGGGVAYLHGGWQSIVDDLTDRARAAGVALFDHTTATGLTHHRVGWTVATPDHTIAAGSVVLAAGGPQVAVNLLGEDPADWVERAGPALRASCLDVGGTRGDLDFLQGTDTPMYLSQHAPTSHTAPDGQWLYSVMRYLAPDDESSADENRAALERHAAIAGLPTGDDRTLERFLAACTVTWGSPQVGVARPTGMELADRGLFAAGDWIGKPLLADASLVSGATAGAAAAKRAMVTV